MARALFLLLALTPLFLQGWQVRRRWQDPPPRPGQDSVTRYLARFADAARLLPASGRIGYLGDAPRDLVEMALDPATGLYLAQHALAPRILVPGSDAAWVLCNFHDPAECAARREGLGLELVRAFGSGVAVLRRR